ncbi:MAG: MmcQ/YjbR family DNA-binding protein [Ruminococcus sp.]|nr:MmcQ/YjbR family DNA-binding protein [Ruminococcus sp.]MCM1480132.1 MmcQ/YjbR family DNA-binding protein [Muribaculaceae bacterium]
MTREEYIEYCKTIAGASVDCPFEDAEATVARHSDTRKWFALVMEVGGRHMVNLKCEPMEADFLRGAYEGVTPAYHMNKVHWNSVYLDSDVPREEIENMTMRSYELTMKKVKRKK